MIKTEAKIKVEVWQCGKILLEKYSYGSGLVEPLPKHSHAEYQLGRASIALGNIFIGVLITPYL